VRLLLLLLENPLWVMVCPCHVHHRIFMDTNYDGIIGLVRYWDTW